MQPLDLQQEIFASRTGLEPAINRLWACPCVGRHLLDNYVGRVMKEEVVSRIALQLEPSTRVMRPREDIFFGTKRVAVGVRGANGARQWRTAVVKGQPMQPEILANDRQKQFQQLGLHSQLVTQPVEFA